MLNYDAIAANQGGGGLPTKVTAKKITPLGNRVICSDMHFGERTTSGGIIITSDDGKDRGIKPRWGRVVAKGKDNDDPYDIGDWILVEHGRWSRGFEVDTEGNGEYVTMRLVEAESVLLWDNEKPEDMLWGNKEGAGDTGQAKPEDFGAR
jgi:co-chaperonin GroES (HSP10)